MVPIKVFDKQMVQYDDHVVPIIKIPTDIKQFLTDNQQKNLEKACLDRFLAAKKCLDESIADVASKHERALEFAGELASRVLVLMDIVANSGLDDRLAIKETTALKLQKLGVSKEAMLRSPALLKELRKGVLKRIIISGAGEVEKGNLTESGYVGMNSLAIQNAAKGNLRERMYIPYKSTWEFTEKLLSDVNNVDIINNELKKAGHQWQLNVAVIDELKSKNTDNSLYQLGAFAASRNNSRTFHSAEYQRQYQQLNPDIRTMDESRIPLSQRELLAQSGDLNKKSEKKVQWLPGEAWYGVEALSESHPSLKAAEQSGDLMLTGISGTTDAILTMGHILGVFDGEKKEEKMREGMLACMGWMIDAKDHTAHEIQTSAKSFGLTYTPGPDSYKQIRPGDARFEHDLRGAQKKRGFEMPDDVLKEKCIRKIAREIFPELYKMKARQMKRDVSVQEEPVAPHIEKKLLF